MFLKNFFLLRPFNLDQFNTFFESGMSSLYSPILNEQDKKLSANLPLKGALLSSFFYIIALITHWTDYTNVSNIFILFTFFLSGTPALIKAIKDLLHKNINIDILMTLAAFGSLFIKGEREGALLLVLFSLSEALNNLVNSKAKSTLSSLKKIVPTKAWIILPNGKLISRMLKEIKINDIIKIKSGEIVPLDGIISEGNSSLNLMHLTGEYLPIPCKEGDSVPAGAINLEGSFDLQVTKTSSNSTLEHIINLVIEAQKNKPRLQKALDLWSSRYAITIIIISVVISIFPVLFKSSPFFSSEGSLFKALAFLIAASPCALIIAVPIAYLSSINSCAKKGILIKGGGSALDILASCNMIAFDKTGTLTTGNLLCTTFSLIEGNENKLLAIAASLEASSSHPIALAITNFVQKKNIVREKIINHKIIPGYGVEGELNGCKVAIGEVSWLSKTLPEKKKFLIEGLVNKAKEKNKICSLVIFKNNIGLFFLQDQPRKDLVVTIKQLHSKKLKTVILTGDHAKHTLQIAKKLNINTVFYDLKPEDKLNLITKLSKENKLIMIGDGINDAPALAKASLGISMGQIGSATAIEASDIVFLHDRLDFLPWLLQKASLTKKIVQQNISLALFIILGISIPSMLGITPLWLAVILHEGSTLIVGLNALRLLKTKS